jgi:putative membrane protein
MVTWFAGLFYLPRLFVNLAMVEPASHAERERLMERRLYTMTTIGLVGTWIFGIATLLAAPDIYMKSGWLHAKLLLVIALSGYHGWLKTRVRAFAEQRNTKSAKFYRLMNEVPSVMLLAIILLVVLKPF